MTTNGVKQDTSASQPMFVAAHVGSGYHSQHLQSAYLQGMEPAIAVMTVLAQQVLTPPRHTALQTACQAAAAAKDCHTGVQHAIQALEASLPADKTVVQMYASEARSVDDIQCVCDRNLRLQMQGQAPT